MNKNRSSYGDKYYTQPHVIRECIRIILEHLISSSGRFVDFSAGNGVLKKFLPSEMVYEAYDIDPMDAGVLRGDWLTLEIEPEPSIIGFNPPFGRMGKLAHKFIEKAFNLRPTLVAVILPVRHWPAPIGYRRVHQSFLSSEAFYYPDDGPEQPVSISSEFIVWKRDPTVLTAEELQIPVKASDTGKFDQDIQLLVRKVGHYAGRQMYFLNRKDKRVYYWPGNVQEGTTRQPMNSIDMKLWESNGHIVCKTDPKKTRQGTGFLKIKWIRPQQCPIKSYEEFKIFAARFERFIECNNLNTGLPKSISAAIAERVIMDS